MTPEDRERALRERLDEYPEDTEALRALAELLQSHRDRKSEAVEVWRRYVDAVPEHTRSGALLELARALIEARQEEEAVGALESCLGLEPDSVEALDLLGELQRRAGDLESAVDAFTRAIELEPEAIRPRVALVACYDALGRSREARAALQSLAELGAENPAIRALVQELMHRRG